MRIALATTYSLVALSLLFSPIPSQARPETLPPPEERIPGFEMGWQDAAVFGANAAISCLISGFGARSNHQNFWEGCAKGAFIAAPFIYAGQKMGAYTGFYPGLGYAATGVHSLGVSVRDNVAEGIGMFDRYQWNLGPLQFSLGKPEFNDGHAVNFYLMPLPIAGLVYGAAAGDFDTEMSLKLGIPVFKGNLSLAEDLNQSPVGGVSIPNVMMVEDDKDILYTAGHEFIHHLNYRELSFLDGVFENNVYGKRFRKYHLKFGADIGAMGIQIFGVVPHEYRPAEWIPEALEVERPD